MSKMFKIATIAKITKVAETARFEAITKIA